MRLFKAKIRENMSSAESVCSFEQLSTVDLKSLIIFREDHRCFMILGPMSVDNALALISTVELKLRYITAWSPEESVLELVRGLNGGDHDLFGRVLVPVENYSLYQLRLKEYPYYAVNDLVKAAKKSLNKRQPLEFIYASLRNAANENYTAGASHTVLVKSLDELGFVGMTAHGHRRFLRSRTEGAALLEPGIVNSEKILMVNFTNENSVTSAPSGDFSKTGVIGKEARVKLSLGVHVGNGGFAFEYPFKKLVTLPYGSS